MIQAPPANPADIVGGGLGRQKVLTLTRPPNGGFGMEIVTNNNDVGARVSKILPGLPADLSGKVRLGDRIMQANGFDLQQSTLSEVLAALALSSTMTLILQEDDSDLGT